MLHRVVATNDQMAHFARLEQCRRFDALGEVEIRVSARGFLGRAKDERDIVGGDGFGRTEDFSGSSGPIRPKHPRTAAPAIHAKIDDSGHNQPAADSFQVVFS
jgi:hypothetical protein